MTQENSVFTPEANGASGTGVTPSAAGMTENDRTSPSASGDSEVTGRDGGKSGAESLSDAFDAMIKGEYKAEYDRRVSETVRRRLKGQREQLERLEAEHARLKASVSEGQLLSRADSLYSRWTREEAAAREKFPSLDIRRELSDPRFAALIRAGVDVESAYTALHKDEIIPALMGHTADVVRRQLSEELASGRNRPAENGIASRGAVSVMSSVASMTREERADIARRVARGERISF